jgi:hypothetical protein
MTDLLAKDITWPSAVEVVIPARGPWDCPFGSRKSYCHENKINRETVSKPVKEYMRLEKRS